MAKKTYNPSAKYVVVAKGSGNVRHPKLGIINVLDVDDAGDKITFDMAHRTSNEIAYLVEHKQVIMLHADWLKTSEAKAAAITKGGK